ncbi:MAG: tRNA-dihydrouridine synthase family protein [Desulfobacteraceae bacterium]|nr:tRNA-dihydrouridine synthase family protein [Desulfobacteraceae bacterium]
MKESNIDLCLAPLQGLTDVIFRSTYSRYYPGIDWAVTPFLTTSRGPARIKPSQAKEVLPANNLQMRIVPQILDNTASSFVGLAHVLADLGYDMVNWNLGCPFARVAKKKRGSGLLPYPDLIKAFLDEVFAYTRVQVSIKMRLGYYCADEIYSILPIFDQYPIHSLIIHPRTGKQMYTGKPDFEFFEKCLQLSKHSIVYNGDIVCLDSFNYLRGRFTGVKTWMIGRGVLTDPLLPARIKGCPDSEQAPVERFSKFHDALVHAYEARLSGPGHLVDRMKGFWSYFSLAFKNGRDILKQVRKSKNIDHYLSAAHRFFESAVYKTNRDS